MKVIKVDKEIILQLFLLKLNGEDCVVLTDTCKIQIVLNGIQYVDSALPILVGCMNLYKLISLFLQVVLRRHIQWFLLMLTGCTNDSSGVLTKAPSLPVASTVLG